MAKKKTSAQVHRFTATIVKGEGKGAWSWIEFPHDVHELYGTRAAVRIKGTMNGLPIDRALIPTKSGLHVIIVSNSLRKSHRLKDGVPVKVEVWRNEDQDEVIVPEDLQETLDFMPELKAAWDKISAGKRRGICHWVGSGKTVETRAKRVAEVLRRFETGHEWFKRTRSEPR